MYFRKFLITTLVVVVGRVFTIDGARLEEIKSPKHRDGGFMDWSLNHFEQRRNYFVWRLDGPPVNARMFQQSESSERVLNISRNVRDVSAGNDNKQNNNSNEDNGDDDEDEDDDDDDDHLIYSIEEEVQIGTFVGDLGKDAFDGKVFQFVSSSGGASVTEFSGESEKRTFKLINQAPSVSSSFPVAHHHHHQSFSASSKWITNCFVIDEQSGHIRSNERIDREALCPKSAAIFKKSSSPSSSSSSSSSSLEEILQPCRLWLHVAILPLNRFVVIKVGVDVIDVNDNAPRFEASTLELEAPEDLPVASTFQLPAASDLDGAAYDVQRYTLEEVQVSGSRDWTEWAND